MTRLLPVYLSVDVGTGSARAALFDECGQCIARGEAPFLTNNPQPDYYEQSTVLILKAVRESIQQTLREAAQAGVQRSLARAACSEPDRGTPPANGIVSVTKSTLNYEFCSEVHVAQWRLCGIGVDATCSLVVVSPEQAAFFGQTASERGTPAATPLQPVPGGISVSPSSTVTSADQPETTWDVIVWMDHRAEAEAAEINADRAECTRDILRFYGGCMSPENEPPKLVWLRRHRPDALARAAAVMDLSDFLVFVLTGNLEARGLCPVAAKWAYRTDEMRWDARFYERWGLDDLFARGCFGRETRMPGQRVSGPSGSMGLSEIASVLLLGAAVSPPLETTATTTPTGDSMNCSDTGAGLNSTPARFVWDYRDVVVASGMVDAHAGAIGALSMQIPTSSEKDGADSLPWNRTSVSLEADYRMETNPTKRFQSQTGADERVQGAVLVTADDGAAPRQQTSGHTLTSKSVAAPTCSTDDAPLGDKLHNTMQGSPSCSDGDRFDWSQRIAVIAGTSTCHMICARQAVFVRGVWGPHRSAVLPEMWLNEGGQSVTGRLLDYLVESHAASLGLGHLRTAAIHERLCRLGLQQMRRAASIHVYPDFHGNRSFLADPRMSGAIIGLRLDTFTNVDAFAALYLATVQALGYGTRQIIERLNEAGHDICVILLCGGMLKNDLFVRCLPDTCQMPVVFAERSFDVMLLGGAICARCAHLDSDLFRVISSMNGGPHQRFHRLDPQPAWRPYHEAKYRIFQRMQQEQLAYRAEMTDVLASLN
ncbi:hypothetical protein CCYA_CCYA01G0070 [Cyanidiococcus yangmingshanensis]|nr:hypothetical protein CCYA_CCYA01G0070 [Cyanidiococcus yangmingshanensis]